VVHDYGRAVGGAEHMSLALRDGLLRRGHEARLLASDARVLDIPVLADRVCHGTTSSARRVLQVANPLAVRALRRELADFPPDVVHLRMFLTQLSPLVLALLRDVPTLLHVVNYDLICPLNTKVLPGGAPCRHRAGRICRTEGCLPVAGLARAAAQRALVRHWRSSIDLVVTNSRWVRRRLEADGVSVDATVANGVPSTDARPPLDGPPTVAYAGRLVAKKGVATLIEAMARVVRDVPSARLIVAGDGPLRADLTGRAAALGLGERVEFLGHLGRPAVERALATAWVQAVPSLWEEPFGLVTAEAAMRGTAAVVSDRGGSAEIVRPGETGLLVPPGDAAALAGALTRLLRDRAEAERMGAAARRMAVVELTEERAVDGFLDLYQRMPGRGAVTRAEG
jgi:glycosyltransferase involved in cell wall biosynthesis